MKRLLPVFALALAVACSNDSAGPRNADLGGPWLIGFSNLSGTGVSCNITTSGMSLSMSGGGSTSFSGTYGPMTLSCTSPSGAFQQTLEGAIANGTVGITDVSFDLDTQAFHQVGKTSSCAAGECAGPVSSHPNYMNGTAHWTLDLGGGQTALLNGSWSAARQ